MATNTKAVETRSGPKRRTLSVNEKTVELIERIAESHVPRLTYSQVIELAVVGLAKVTKLKPRRKK